MTPGVQVLKYPSVYVVSVGVPKVFDADEGAHSGFVAPVATVNTSPVFPIPSLSHVVPLKYKVSPAVSDVIFSFVMSNV